MRLLISVLLLSFASNSIHKSESQATHYEAQYEQRETFAFLNAFHVGIWRLAVQARQTRTEQDDPYDSRRDCLYRIYLLATILGVIGGLAGVYVLYRQTKATEESARAAKDAAQAADKNATYIINSERAWVIVKMVKTDHETFMLSLRNVGRTPARISIIKQLETFIPPSEALVLGNDFRYDSPLKFMHPPMLVPRQRWDWIEDVTHLPSVLPGEVYRDVMGNRRRYWLYGKVEYTDTIKSEQHETRFCFFYSTMLDNMIVGGPLGANDYT